MVGWKIFKPATDWASYFELYVLLKNLSYYLQKNLRCLFSKYYKLLKEVIRMTNFPIYQST